MVLGAIVSANDVPRLTSNGRYTCVKGPAKQNSHIRNCHQKYTVSCLQSAHYLQDYIPIIKTIFKKIYFTDSPEGPVLIKLKFW